MERLTRTGEDQCPRGLVPLGAFFGFGATVAAYAAITWLKLRRALDQLRIGQNGSRSARVARRDRRVGFVALPGTGMGCRNDDHRNQRRRPDPCREGRVTERHGGSDNRRPAAVPDELGCDPGAKPVPARPVVFTERPSQSSLPPVSSRPRLRPSARTNS
jgi:hypothetical protein